MSASERGLRNTVVHHALEQTIAQMVVGDLARLGGANPRRSV